MTGVENFLVFIREKVWLYNRIWVSDATELPRRKYTTFRKWQKYEIKITILMSLR